MSRLIRSIAPNLSALLLATGSTVALADPPAAAPPVQASTTVSAATIRANPEDKVVCKYEVPIGSRLGGHKTCMKKSDWDAQAQAIKDQLTLHAAPSGTH